MKGIKRTILTIKIGSDKEVHVKEHKRPAFMPRLIFDADLLAALCGALAYKIADISPSKERANDLLETMIRTMQIMLGSALDEKKEGEPHE